MLVDTVKGDLVLDFIPKSSPDAMMSLGIPVDSALVYDFCPDTGWRNTSIRNLSHCELIKVEISEVRIFEAVVKTFNTELAYDKLKEFGIIK